MYIIQGMTETHVHSTRHDRHMYIVQGMTETHVHSTRQNYIHTYVRILIQDIFHAKTLSQQIHICTEN